MANFDGNFRCKETNEVCPVCGLHKDLQQLSFECPVLKKEMIITENYESIFTSTITKNLADISSMKGPLLVHRVLGAGAEIPFLSKQSLDSLY